MVSLGEKKLLQEEDFKLRCRLFDWKDGQEEWLWKGHLSRLWMAGCAFKEYLCFQNEIIKTSET